MKALVLSGGSVKGSFQAGVIKSVFEHGFYPDYIYGISVGSLNTVFLVNQIMKKEKSEYESASKKLVDFWSSKVTKPKDLIIEKGYAKLIWNILRGKFDGLVDNSPLKKIIHENIDLSRLYKSEVNFSIGATNYMSGEIIYSEWGDGDILDFTLASTAIPMIMSPVMLREDPFYDGGLRDVAPLKKAIDVGADEIVVILCQPEKMGSTKSDYRKIFPSLERIIDIMINEIENNDIFLCKIINENILNYPNKKQIKLTVIRPEIDLKIDIQNFTSDDISRLIKLGYDTAEKILKQWIEPSDLNINIDLLPT